MEGTRWRNALGMGVPTAVGVGVRLAGIAVPTGDPCCSCEAVCNLQQHLLPPNPLFHSYPVALPMRSRGLVFFHYGKMAEVTRAQCTA